MRTYHLPDEESVCQSVLGIGVFDGLHLAHQVLLVKVRELSRENQIHSAVLTFDPPPPLFFKQEGYKLLLTLEEKIDQLRQMQIDLLFLLKFSQQISDLSPQDFCTEIILNKTRARIVVVGDNFLFGRNREGNAFMLRRFGEENGFRTVIIPMLCAPNREFISSTLIRQLIGRGAIKEANQLLGSPYTVSLQKIGPGLFALKDPTKLLPAPGRYQAFIRGSMSKIEVQIQDSNFLLSGIVDSPIRLSFLNSIA